MSRSFAMDPADRFTASAVGEPGQRTFFMQAWAGNQRCTLLAERQQVHILGEAVLQLLDNLPEGPEGPVPPPGSLDLEEPLDPEWRAGEMSIAYDGERDLVAITITEAIDPEAIDPEDPDAPETALIVLTRAQARAAAANALEVVSRGRPRCQLCGNPMGPEGVHMCPASNGHRSHKDDDA